MTVFTRKIALLCRRSWRFLILGSVLFFLLATLKENWQQAIAIRLDARSWQKLAIATVIILIAHTWSGWVWGKILAQLDRPVSSTWAIRVYLKTNIAKYLPGNMWHFYGRIKAAQQQQIPWDCATVSIFLETLLMAIAGLIIALAYPTSYWLYQLLLGAAIALTIHPQGLNPILQFLTRLKLKNDAPTRSPTLKCYPLLSLLGELLFLLCRGAGFYCIMLAITTINSQQILPLFSAFSAAWVLGLIVPGAPGGIGIFESTAIALLGDTFTPGIVLGSVALYRLINTLAEALGALLAWGFEALKS
ncbi:MAG: UPF0104 family protein [Jaaginema sp. PMC 1079.18]|nr:UPF0104 family protein [Jaaginema sp. PMC 1080.18]MEC4851593.1 UPF0104 family protein [Jaaginema sp. PMC 1079.18]